MCNDINGLAAGCVNAEPMVHRADVGGRLVKDPAGVGVGENLTLFPICMSNPLHALHF